MPFMTRTPLRVSLFGGGTDHPAYFHRAPGAVVGMAIDKHIYISCTRVSTPIQYRYRVAYSKLEMVDAVTQIEHPVVRAVLTDYGVDEALDISVQSDLPASGGGLGSSSAFTVGFVSLMRAMAGDTPTKLDIATEAIRFERDVLQENVGVQDQFHAAFGGLNRFDFSEGRIRISPVQVSGRTLRALNDSMILIYSGVARRSTDIVATQLAATQSKVIDPDLARLYALVEQCVSHLEAGGADLVEGLGAMLHESWMVKRQLTPHVSSAHIDAVYEAAMGAGALGGKLCGAGGGGFLLMLARPDQQEAVRAVVAPLPVLPIRMDAQGVTVLYGHGGGQGQPALRLKSPPHAMF
jgi:D-glycero-alpha-D-manno-heptose-7-phosphate kinase